MTCSFSGKLLLNKTQMKKAEYGATVEPNNKLEKGRRQCSHKEGDSKKGTKVLTSLVIIVPKLEVISKYSLFYEYQNQPKYSLSTSKWNNSEMKRPSHAAIWMYLQRIRPSEKFQPQRHYCKLLFI